MEKLTALNIMKTPKDITAIQLRKTDSMLRLSALPAMLFVMASQALQSTDMSNASTSA